MSRDWLFPAHHVATLKHRHVFILFFIPSTCHGRLKISLREQLEALRRSYICCNGDVHIIKGCLATLGLSRTAF